MKEKSKWLTRCQKVFKQSLVGEYACSCKNISETSQRIEQIVNSAFLTDIQNICRDKDISVYIRIMSLYQSRNKKSRNNLEQCLLW